MDTPLFDAAGIAAPAPLHDPKGKTRTALKGVVATADVSPCGRWRRSLTRDWTSPGQAPRAVLWVGMNPSTADALVDDPTCTREQGFTRRWGYTRYLKGNVLDWRATFPTDIPKDPTQACTGANLQALAAMALEAEIVVAAWGKLPHALAPLAARTHAFLVTFGKPILCLGTNGDGSPKHPLYLRSDSAPRPFGP
jgi:hypothetical protein